MTTQAGALEHEGGTIKGKRPFGMRDRIGYMFGDFGNDFTFILQMLFFMLFYTKVVGINPAHVGTLFFAARIVDAFTDVGMGRIVDTAKATAAGKFRPWIARGAIPVALASALMYQSFIAGWDSYGARLAWMCITYFLWGSITYTMINIPYGSMASVISPFPKDRSELSVWRSTGAQLAILLLSVVLPLIVYVKVDGQSTLSGSRMTIAAIICSVIAVIWYALCYLLVTERIEPPARVAGENMSFAQLFGSLFKSRALMGIVAAALLLLVSNFLVSGMLGYLILDYFNDKGLQSTAQMAALIPAFSLIVIAPWLGTKFGKREIGVVSMIVGGLVMIGTYFLDLQGAPMTWVVLYAVAQFCISIFNFLVWAFITDVIDAEEVRTGERNDGTIYAVYSWARKMGQALAGGLTGWALSWIGYQSSKGGQTVTQSQETLDGIWMYSTLIPGILLIGVALALQFFYPLSKKRVDANVAFLAEKRAQQQGAAVAG
ncbi:glycoside-pentoside-hexuronide (GPH):cation symporter [Luteococcus peritonei]|uniref:MFS transporter n=1 Tax=Luteococcus peritonei TaxID=88874 RepID=A0ABW4RUX7_9ACTN